ncbi:SUMF1/EgtB/PvdO family nonheme iron enzyme [Cuspidothrix issatschenkoi LEGE 03284]|jgi:formylglycine-generating enzyme required for sulfatase activity|uniref:SUMF1/EgtB/PvdO family nonheme iron enzyme n=1 Tax=Cuspidothrix issatschenkoi TaxID=230752 RepID=UPI001881BB59|nr:SUMF1/EgtB/PvdO family nonheme iron enzyme [Cuspidothrix issatschenkoi]MBE9230835.1 SUMF1/EgtB/PvdO family nonheme iron enzyme [Cuspidothrix issatschenkoi LEGE 03284]
MEESESKTGQQKNFHYSVAHTDTHIYIEGTPAPDELVKILDRILDGSGNENDIGLLRQCLRTVNGQNQVQLANYIVNLAEGNGVHIGDRITYQGIDEETKIILRQLQQFLQKSQVSISPNFSPQTPTEKFLVNTNSHKQVSRLPPELNSFEFEVVTVDYKGRETKRERKQAQYFLEDVGSGVVLEMVSIQAGRFQMGASREEDGSKEDERPQHLVNIKPFFMGRYPITQAQWRAIANLPKINRHLNPDPSYFKGDNLPVERVSWYEAQELCARISQKTGRIYRLPSEAEWEYACRANITYPFYFGSKITRGLANFCEEQKTNVVHRNQTTEVGTFFANSFGLYDMHGNVWEWCADYQHEDYQDAPLDGTVWEIDGNPEYRMLRGGSWDYDFSYCRSASRYFENPSTRNRSFGFRVVCGN